MSALGEISMDPRAGGGGVPWVEQGAVGEGEFQWVLFSEETEECLERAAPEEASVRKS